MECKKLFIAPDLLFGCLLVRGNQNKYLVVRKIVNYFRGKKRGQKTDKLAFDGEIANLVDNIF